MLAGGRTVSLVLTLRAIRVEDDETLLDWAVEGRVGEDAMPAATMLTRCVPESGSDAPWVGLLESFLGVRLEGERFSVPANAAAGDEWSSDAVWRGPNGRMREVRHARATGREACATPIGTRDCLRYEVDVTLSDESPLPDRVATTHARGVEWVTEGIGLVRSELDDGSHLGPRITLTALRDP